MNAHDETRLLIELYADGEIDPADRARVERLLEEDPEAAEYLLAVQELSAAVRIPVDMAVEAALFEGLADRIMAATAVTQRDAELEMLAMAMADGELLSADDQARVDAYLDAVPEAREGVEAVRELGDLTRLPVEAAMEGIDFDLLAARIDQAITAEPTAQKVATEAPAEGLWASMVAFFTAHRGVFASALASAAVVAILLPLLTPSQPTVEPGGETIEIHNHYYGAESVNYQPGYWGASQPGDLEEGIAPVIWIAPEPVVKVQTPEDELVPVTARPHERPL